MFPQARLLSPGALFPPGGISGRQRKLPPEPVPCRLNDLEKIYVIE